MKRLIFTENYCIQMMKNWLFLFVLCVFFSCSPGRYIQPLKKKQQAVNLSLGGPLIKYGNATIPVPFLVANYGYGVDSNLTTFGSVNITSALFGNLQLELGATLQLLSPKRYTIGLSVTPTANIIYRNKQSFKFYPEIAVNAFYPYGKRKNYFYAGIDNWFEPAQKRAYDEPQTHHWFFSPQIGHNFSGQKWDVQLEVKIMAPNISNKGFVVEYQTPFQSHGALGVFLAYTRKF